MYFTYIMAAKKMQTHEDCIRGARKEINAAILNGFLFFHCLIRFNYLTSMKIEFTQLVSYAAMWEPQCQNPKGNNIIHQKGAIKEMVT